MGTRMSAPDAQPPTSIGPGRIIMNTAENWYRKWKRMVGAEKMEHDKARIRQ